MSRRPYQRKKLIWRVYWDNLSNTPGIQINGTNGNVSRTDTTLITDAEVGDFDDECTVIRVVGEQYFNFVAQDGSSALGYVQLIRGITVLDASYTASVIQVDDVTDAQDTEWSWLRTYRGMGSAYSDEGGNTFASDDGGLVSAHIDCKVKRKLRAGDRLLMFFAAYSAEADWTCRIWTNLRILVEA